MEPLYTKLGLVALSLVLKLKIDRKHYATDIVLPCYFVFLGGVFWHLNNSIN